ncbi:MAG: hypothetical protein IKJ43_00180 [Bacilli bacterium]|nr:hypothetical protein [Bacilli bacterium]
MEQLAYTKTELHTHLFGMLSAKELLKIVQEYTNYIYWPLNKGIDNNSKLIKISEILEDEEAIDQLRIKHGKQVDYEELDNYYNTRTAIISYLESLLFLNNNKKPIILEELLSKDNDLRKIIMNETNYNESYYEDEGISIIMKLMEHAKNAKTINPTMNMACKKTVYSDYINRALKELINSSVEYVEISYSYGKIISLMEIEPEIANKIKCKFLLSTGRDRSVKQMQESSKDLKEALSRGMTVGFDIMGQEQQLTDQEKVYRKGKRSKSFKRKLEILVDALIDEKESNNTLRIHSGESRVSFGNTEWILNALYEIKNDYLNMTPSKNILPPPELRIGHGLYFEKNDTYIQRLKDFHAIIEINASSNLALGNINDYYSLPYDYYVGNGIPIVISTDGHGLYDTDIKREDIIAQIISNHYDIISETDSDILERKMKQ